MEYELDVFVHQLNENILSTKDEFTKNVQSKELSLNIKEALAASSFFDPSVVVTLLLSQDSGLLNFISYVKRQDQTFYSETLKIILEIIQLVFIKYSNHIHHEQLPLIKDAVMKFTQAKEAALRKLAYNILCCIIETAALSPNDDTMEKLKLELLLNQIFISLGQSTFDTAVSVKKSFFVLLGSLAKHFPFLLKDRASRILKHVLLQLEKEVKNSNEKMEHAIVTGYVEALSGLLVSFQDNNMVVTSGELDKLQDLLLEIIQQGLTGKKRESSRAALTAALAHSSILSRGFIKNYKTWFDCLKFFALHKNPEDKKLGAKVFSKFIEVISHELTCKSPDSFSDKGIVVEFFVRSMFEILESEEASTKLKILAVKALGELSKTVSPTNALHIYDYISRKAIYLCLQEDAPKNVFAIYPVCLEAIGLFLTHHGSVMKCEDMSQLQKICIQIFSRYLDIAEQKQHLCGRALVVFLIGIWSSFKNPIDFSKFIGDIVTQGLVRSSRPELGSDDLKKYLPLWVGLMNLSQHVDLPLTLEAHVSVMDMLDQQLISSFSTIVKKLNLDIEREENSLEMEERGSELAPKNINDWQLLENLTDLLQNIANSIEPKERMVAHLIPFGGEIIAASLEYPHVLGFYRLCALVLKIVGNNMPVSEQQSYQNFMSALVARLPQLSTNALMSAVQAILSSPTWLVNSIRGSISSALISALKVGLTDPELATWPLNALELWQIKLKPSDFDNIMNEVLPHLELYLYTSEKHEKNVFSIQRSKAKNYSPLNVESWNLTQRRVLKLMGDLGPSCGSLAIRNEDEIVNKLATEWRGSTQLTLKLPLNDIDASISLETFLPLVLHLVYHSSDFKARMAACEFLHAVYVLLIGITSQQREDYRSRHSSSHLYKKLFPAVVDLAVDSDLTVRILFENLLAQTVHWFSRPSFCSKDSTGRQTILGTEAGLLVEVLVESVCTEDETSLVRDIAANSLREFLDWSVKQSSESILRVNPAVPEFVFQKLRALATHPSPKQRLGAAIICNNIYRSFRNCEPLVSLFTLDLFAHFVVSLSMADKDQTEVGTQERCESAVYQLGRIIYQNKSMFSTPDPHRRTAPLLVKGTIDEINELLMKNVFSERLRTRRLCMSVCRALLRPTSIVIFAKDFLQKNPFENFIRSASFEAVLDVCRLLLHHGVIDITDFKDTPPFKLKYGEFLHSLSRSLNNHTRHYVEHPGVFLTWLDFLAECSSKTKDITLLPISMIVRSLLQPSSVGYPPNDLKPRQDFYKRFEKLLPSLKHYLQSVLETAHLVNFEIENADYSHPDILDLLHGFNTLASFGLLDLATFKVNSPAALLKFAVDPLIANCKLEECQQQIKASSWLIEIAIQLGLSMDSLAAELKDPSVIQGTPFVKGQYVRAKMGQSLWKVVLDKPRNITPFCPEIGNGDSQQWHLLNELLLAALSLQKLWVVGKLLESWKMLLEHAKNYGQMSYFRAFVNTLIRLDHKKVRESGALRRWVIDSWNDSNADITFAKESAYLLKIFNNDCTLREENDVINALNNFFSSHFPSKTSNLRTDLEKSDYYSVFNSLLDIADTTPVCNFLIGVFSLEPQHPQTASFIIWMNDWMKTAPLNVLEHLFEILHQKTTMLTVPALVRIQAVESLYVPLLSSTTFSALDAHCQGILREFVQASKAPISSSELILKRIVLCNIMSTFVTRLGFQPLTSNLNASYCTIENIQPTSDGKNLLRSITKFALDIRKLTTPSSGIDVNMFQKLHGYAFKLIYSIASVSALDEVAVDKLVFKPLTPALWNAIVGTTKEYSLTAEIDRGKRQFLVHLSTSSEDSESNYGYAPSQYLYATSLSEDVYRFDFNNASVNSQSTYVGSRAANFAGNLDQEEIFASFNLTLNELNQHYLMAPLVAFVREQGDKALGCNGVALEPPWMITLRETLVNPNVHRNVVLFIFRLVLNLEPLFRTFAKSWYNALLVSLLRRLGGEPLNSLFRDGLEMMLDWCKDIPPRADDNEFIKLASSTVEFVAKNITRGNAEVVKDNKDMFRAMLNVWAGLPLKIPKILLDEMLISNRSNQITALLLLDAILTHGFLQEADEWVLRLKDRLVELLSDYEKRDVLRTTAFVCGSILSRHLDEDFEKRIVEKLANFHAIGKHDVFVDALFEITRYHASILRLVKLPYLNLKLLASLHGTLKARCLEILSVSWQHIEDPWKEIGRNTIEDILKRTNPAELTPVLKLLMHLIPRLDFDEWMPLWGRLVRLAQHENVTCRRNLYELLKIAFEKAPTKAEFAQALLRACADRNQELGSSVQNFLAEKLPNSVIDRIFYYLEYFYSPVNEDYFLPYFSYFLLERTTKSPRYREPIFERPLDDVPFETLDLFSLSSQRKTQSIRGPGSFLLPQTIRAGFLRATQQPGLHTMDTLQGPKNWLTNETLKQEPLESSSILKSPSKSKSSLAIPSSPMKSWKRFADSSATLPSPEKRSSYTKRTKTEEVTSQPTIYRRYRRGELPDIQIPLSALLAPLQALALVDPLVAKTLFCALLSAVREKIKEVKGDNQEFVSSLSKLLRNILMAAETHGSSANIISAILECSWMNTANLDMEAEKIYGAAKKHHRHQLGILVLESLLPIKESNHGQQTKKLKVSSRSKHSPSDWFLVADSYADLDDMDSARATIIHLTGCEESTIRAVECEKVHDWEGAFSYYSQSLTNQSPTEREESFCQQYQFKCLEILGEWEEIELFQPGIEPWNTRASIRKCLQSFDISKELDTVLVSDDLLYPEIAALEVKLGRKELALNHIRRATASFLERYSLLSPLEFRGRRSLLERVCLVTEVQKFLSEISSLQNLSLPKSGDNMLVWDSMLAIRGGLVDCIETDVLSDHLTILPLELASLAVDQKNYLYARKLIENMKNVPHSKMARHKILLSKIYAMQLLRRPDLGRKLENLIRAKTTVSELSFFEDPQDRVEFENLQSMLCFEIASLGAEAPFIVESKRSLIEEIWDSSLDEMVRNGIHHAKLCTEICKKGGSNCDAGHAYYTLAKYLQLWKTHLNADEFDREFTTAILNSMRFGSQDGASLFPLIIALVKDSQIARESFTEKSAKIPVHTFLPYVNQLVSHCPIIHVFETLLLDLAKKYPINVRIPLQISRPNFAFHGQEAIVKNIESQLAEDVALNMFIRSIDYLRPPEIVASEVLHGDTDFETFRAKYLNLEPPFERSPYGHIHFRFSKTFSTKFENAYREGKLFELKEQLRSIQGTTRPDFPHSLRDFSPWMANYRFGEESWGELWLPMSKGKTLRIESFRDDIRFFFSKQFPVKVTLIVDGAKEFSVIVKQGEDVRQDERILQLLDAIDVALVRDDECRKRSLRMRTFKVVPLSVTCGLFEWVEGTVPLKTFLESDSDFKASLDITNRERNNIFARKGLDYYHRAPQDQLNADFKKMANHTYAYGLRGALKRLSQSAEAYFYLRQRFASSHGIQCCALWILGIGDRHLSNSLVSVKTGDVIPIDYGMAFGTATSLLPIPELAPCRLTMQFQQLIPGLGLNGPIRESMVHTLRIARTETETLLASLAVFVTEPTLDWLKHAKRFIKNQEVDHVSKDALVPWSPEDVIKRTRDILNGAHPAEITIQDLQRNSIYCVQEYRNALLEVSGILRDYELESPPAVDNSTKRKLDAAYSNAVVLQSLTVEDQVNLVINQSINAALLGRMYHGWEPWI